MMKRAARIPSATKGPAKPHDPTVMQVKGEPGSQLGDALPKMEAAAPSPTAGDLPLPAPKVAASYVVSGRPGDPSALQMASAAIPLVAATGGTVAGLVYADRRRKAQHAAAMRILQDRLEQQQATQNPAGLDHQKLGTVAQKIHQLKQLPRSYAEGVILYTTDELNKTKHKDEEPRPAYHYAGAPV